MEPDWRCSTLPLHVVGGPAPLDAAALRASIVGFHHHVPRSGDSYGVEEAVLRRAARVADIEQRPTAASQHLMGLMASQRIPAAQHQAISRHAPTGTAGFATLHRLAEGGRGPAQAPQAVVQSEGGPSGGSGEDPSVALCRDHGISVAGAVEPAGVGSPPRRRPVAYVSGARGLLLTQIAAVPSGRTDVLPPVRRPRQRPRGPTKPRTPHLSKGQPRAPEAPRPPPIATGDSDVTHQLHLPIAVEFTV